MQATPSLTGGGVPFTQPTAGRQSSTPLQKTPSLQILATPRHCPAPLHTSSSVHALPSLQAVLAVIAVIEHTPLAGLHRFRRHCVSLALSQITGVAGSISHFCDVRLQNSVPTHLLAVLLNCAHCRFACAWVSPFVPHLQAGLSGPGVHLPLPHASPTVQMLPSSHGLLLNGFEQPVTGSQTSSVQFSASAQLLFFAGWSTVLLASLQLSSVQATPSLSVGAAFDTQPAPGTQLSVPVQNCPSSHSALFGVFAIVWEPSSHVSTVQAIPSSRFGTGFVLQPKPATQISVPVQNSPSSHSECTGVCSTVSVASSHSSAVQLMLSFVTTSVPTWHVPVAGLQVSTPLQNSPSLHGFSEPTQPPWPLHASLSVHLSPSSHAAPLGLGSSLHSPLAGRHVYCQHGLDGGLSGHTTIELPSVWQVLPVVPGWSVTQTGAPLHTLPSSSELQSSLFRQPEQAGFDWSTPVPRHTPPLHASTTEHGLPSSHGSVLKLFRQPSVVLHVSVVHGLSSARGVSFTALTTTSFVSSQLSVVHGIPSSSFGG